MEGSTDTTVTTEAKAALLEVDSALDTLSPTPESNAPALMFIGYGIAMLSAGQWMLEEGIKRAGGWKGIRGMLARAERAIPVVEETPAPEEIGAANEDGIRSGSTD